MRQKLPYTDRSKKGQDVCPDPGEYLPIMIMVIIWCIVATLKSVPIHPMAPCI